MLQILIGAIFIIFSFQIYSFDILPDFVGYIIIYFGVSKFPNVKNYVNAKPVALLTALISFIFTFGSGFLPDVILLGLNIILILLFIYNIFMIDSGIQEMERYNNIYLKSDKLLSLWRLQSIFTAGSAVLALLGTIIFSSMSTMFGFAATVCNIIFLFHLVSVKEGIDQAGNNFTK